MKILNFMIIILVVSIFNGCAVSNKAYIDKQNDKQIEILDNFEDEDLSSFDEEMEIEDICDPFNGYNRVMTDVNDNLYIYVLKPVSTGFKTVVHKEVRKSIQMFFHNILFPIRFVNNILQGKLENATKETGRFIVNTTVGLLGFFDPASKYFELEKYNEDFGQTLGFYGIGAGPHIVLPLFGPSNLRDILSIYPDSFLNPIIYIDERSANLVHSSSDTIQIKAFETINGTSLTSNNYDKIRKDAVDLYPFLRDVYEQYRDKQIEE